MFNSAQRNYTASERELLGVIHALRKYHYTLYRGALIHVYTDHKSLIGLMTSMTETVITSYSIHYTKLYELAKLRDSVDEETCAFILRLSKVQQANYDILKEELIDKFEPIKTMADCLKNFRTCKQRDGESVVDFTIRFERMLEELQSRSPGLYTFGDTERKQMFLERLLERVSSAIDAMSPLAADSEFHCFKDIYDLARKAEEKLGLRQAGMKQERSSSTVPTDSNPQLASQGGRNSRKSKDTCELCKRKGHTAATCYQLEEFVRKVNAMEAPPTQLSAQGVQPTQLVTQQSAVAPGVAEQPRRLEQRSQPRSDQSAPQGCFV